MRQIRPLVMTRLRKSTQSSVIRQGIAVSNHTPHSETTSLKSAVINYKYRNGRRYHAYKEGSYCAFTCPVLFYPTGPTPLLYPSTLPIDCLTGGPNDETQAEQLDIVYALHPPVTMYHHVDCTAIAITYVSSSSMASCTWPR